ncbi:MAG TPA: hypothetical protein PLI09_09710 [Candidatus Hydrogenedentes bacterium]|nr:hypothetical protein [Candidatus Hydrogenedentota bacterium]
MHDQDLDKVRDPAKHEEVNRQASDEDLIDSWVSRKLRNKPTWQMDKTIRERGLMDRCLEKLAKIMKAGGK